MIKHVIMWKFQEDKQEEMKTFLERLRSLQNQIPQIQSMEIGVSNNPGNNFDAVLIMEFLSMEDLKQYQEDPRHVAVSSLCKSIRLDRGAVDFFVET